MGRGMGYGFGPISGQDAGAPIILLMLPKQQFLHLHGDLLEQVTYVLGFKFKFERFHFEEVSSRAISCTINIGYLALKVYAE